MRSALIVADSGHGRVDTRAVFARVSVAVSQTRRAVMPMFRNMGQQSMGLVDGDDALVDGQDDPNVQCGHLFRRAGEMCYGSREHLLSTPQVVAEVTVGVGPNFLGMVAPTMLAVGVRPEVHHA